MKLFRLTFKKFADITQKSDSLSIKKTVLLMLFREIITLYSENHRKQIYSMGKITGKFIYWETYSED
jgi:hypothetical protein